jgi:hypothetical protein
LALEAALGSSGTMYSVGSGFLEWKKMKIDRPVRAVLNVPMLRLERPVEMATLKQPRWKQNAHGILEEVGNSGLP